MSVVINEFEVLPAQGERERAAPSEPAQPPPAAVQLEVERAVDAARERDARLEAD